jgi:hypothetical protein
MQMSVLLLLAAVVQLHTLLLHMLLHICTSSMPYLATSYKGYAVCCHSL